MRCKLSSNKNLIAIGTGVWKKLEDLLFANEKKKQNISFML